MSEPKDLISDEPTSRAGEPKELETPCLHRPRHLVYLTTKDTPHVYKPETLMVTQVLFLCKNCGEVITKPHMVSRGFLGDGTIHPGMKEELTRIQNKKAVDEQVQAELKKGEASGSAN